MKKLLLACALSLSLCACGTLSALDTIGRSPAPLAQTTFDDKALNAAWKGFDAALDGINLALDLKPSLVGTPGAKRLANAIDAVSAALTAANAAADASSTTNYAEAMRKVESAYVEFRVAILALKGS